MVVPEMAVIVMAVMVMVAHEVSPSVTDWPIWHGACFNLG
jgi:hypothetical protein